MVQTTKRIGRFFVESFPAVHINISNLLELYQLKNIITEAYHVYEPKLISLYRKNIKFISNDICNNIKNISFTKILNNGIKAKIFEYDNILEDIPFIDTLRIYVIIDKENSFYRCEGISVTDNEIVKNDFVKSELPVCIFNNSHFELCSIILYVNQNNLNTNNDRDKNFLLADIYGVLCHELKHILDNCWNKKNLNKTLNQNDIKNELLLKYNVNIDSLTKIYGRWKLKEFVFFISLCLYYCLHSEMSAHIETILSEINLSLKNEDIKNIKLDKKYLIIRYLKWYSETFNIYDYYYEILKLLINIPNNQLFLNISKDDKNDILNMLNLFTNKKYNLHHYIRYWYNQMDKAINNVISLFPKYIEDNF